MTSFESKCSNLKREYGYKGITFNVQDYRVLNNRIVIIFFLNEVPFISTYIDIESLNIHGFSYENQFISEHTIDLVKEITNKIKNIVVLEPFQSTT